MLPQSVVSLVRKRRRELLLGVIVITAVIWGTLYGRGYYRWKHQYDVPLLLQDERAFSLSSQVLPAEEAAALRAKAAACENGVPDSDVVEHYFRCGGRVVGLVFYGRRRYTHVQLPYLMANRRRTDAAGKTKGVLDEVLFIPNTKDEDDLTYIKNLTAALPDFLKLETDAADVVERAGTNAGYCAYYASLTSKTWNADLPSRTMYLKIDDDLVYIHPGALRAMLRMKLESNYLTISANVVNHPLLNHIHQRFGVFEPKVLERAVEEAEAYAAARGHEQMLLPPPEWRERLEFPYEPFSPESWKDPHHAVLVHFVFLHRIRCARGPHAKAGGAAPGGHRGSAGAHSAGGEGAAAASAAAGAAAAAAKRPYDPDVPDERLWADECLGPYRYRLWDFDSIHGGRWSVNCLILEPQEMVGIFDIGKCFSAPGDELYLTHTLPEVMRRHSVAVGDAIVVHLAYWPQRHGGLENTTDILDRYLDLATEVAEAIDDQVPGY